MTDAPPPPARPPGTNAALVLADGSIFWGRGLGATGVSVGVASYPVDGRTIDNLILRADSAMYRAKQTGRGRVAFGSD